MSYPEEATIQQVMRFGLLVLVGTQSHVSAAYHLHE